MTNWHAEIAGREETVLAALRISCRPRGHIRCPFPDHPDKSPSWRWDSREHRYFCTCGSGDIFDVIQRMRGCDFPEAKRFALGDLPPMPSGTYPKLHAACERKIEHRQVRHIIAKQAPARAELRLERLGSPSRLYPYPLPDGSGIYGVIARYEMQGSKTILPWMFDGECWINKRAPNPWPPYRATSFDANPDWPVLWVEGEKTVARAEELFSDFILSTSSGGCKQHKGTDYRLLKARHVTVWPDNDAPGRLYADAIAAHAYEAGAKTIRIVDVPEGWPEKWDLADEPPSDSINLDDILTDARLWRPDAAQSIVEAHV